MKRKSSRHKNLQRAAGWCKAAGAVTVNTSWSCAPNDCISDIYIDIYYLRYILVGCDGGDAP